jgi:hypothetical protein
MPRRLTARIVAAGTIAALIAGFAAQLHAHGARARQTLPADAPATVTVAATAPGPSIPRGFVGFSFEFPAVPAYAGLSPRAPNRVLTQLIRNVDPGGSPIIRIGGDSTDATWWPVPGVARPRSVSYSLSPRWLATARRLADALGARLILGVNLKAGNLRLSLAEAHVMLGTIGRSRIAALEIGNEPGLYGRFPAYRNARGGAVYARGREYGMTQFTREFSTLAAHLPGVPLAGPTLGIPPTSAELRRFLAAEPSVRLATLHRYPLNRCFSTTTSPKFPTVQHLLTPFAGTGLVRSLGDAVRVARTAGLPMQIDELNSVGCSGKRGVSDTFASALWMLDELFAMARGGVAGVNVHTFPGAAYAPFAFRHGGGRWSAAVRPMYYGMLAFARAAPPSARLVPVSVRTSANLNAWATRDRRGRLHVVLINKSLARGTVVNLAVVARHATIATVARLRAPDPAARAGVSLAGQGFGARTFTGRLRGLAQPTVVRADSGPLVLRVPAASAATVVLQLRDVPGSHP